MHPNSHHIMTELLKYHVTGQRTLYDVGSQDVNGTYRKAVEKLGLDYVGIDIEDANNVDVVVPEAAPWPSLDCRDITISGQCLEHTRRPWEWIGEVVKITKPGGLIIIIAPWSWDEHRYPIDCWRILPDGMKSLFEFAGIEPIEVGKSERDCYGVGRCRN